MGNILQGMMGMLSRKKIVAPKADDFVTIARYASAQEKLKPNPRVEAELVTMGAIKTFVSAGSSGSQQLSIAGQELSLTNGGSVTIPSAPALPYTSSFILISQSGTGEPKLTFLSNDAELVLGTDTRMGTGQYYFTFTGTPPAEDNVMIVLPGGLKNGEYSFITLVSEYKNSGQLFINSYGVNNSGALILTDIGSGGDNSIIVEIKVFK